LAHGEGHRKADHERHDPSARHDSDLATPILNWFLPVKGEDIGGIAFCGRQH